MSLFDDVEGIPISLPADTDGIPVAFDIDAVTEPMADAATLRGIISKLVEGSPYRWVGVGKLRCFYCNTDSGEPHDEACAYVWGVVALGQPSPPVRQRKLKKATQEMISR